MARADHITYRVYCRAAEDRCRTQPRVSTAKAVETAQQHTDDTGHPTEVVQIRFYSLALIEPKAVAPDA
jgi:hypothetical protein